MDGRNGWAYYITIYLLTHVYVGYAILPHGDPHPAVLDEEGKVEHVLHGAGKGLRVQQEVEVSDTPLGLASPCRVDQDVLDVFGCRFLFVL